nr:reverse transcriptase domain-containing protein [Tanacetum cinerariifolium]
MEDLKQHYLDEMKRLINLEYHDELKENFNSMSIEINKKEKLQQLEQVANLSTYPSKHFNSFCYHDDDDDEDYTIAVTPSLSTEEPDNSLSMGDEHLDTISATESDEFIKSSIKNLVPIPSEFEGESEKTKRLHDSKIKDRVFNIGDSVLLFNSQLKIFSDKLKSRWSGPFTISHVYPYGTVELAQPDGPNFKVNGHRLKHYFGEDVQKLVVPDLQTFPKDY